MIRYGFFNSESGDRVYNADDFSNFFEGVIGDGIFKKIGQAFETSISSDGKIIVGSGRAMVKNKWIENTANESLDPLPPEESTTRFDSVILRCDMVSRLIELAIKKGSAASAPVLTDDAQMKEIRIANITMAAGVKKPVHIEDVREDSWIHPLVGVHVVQLKKEVTISDATTSITLGNKVDPEADSIDVYINGILLTKSAYTVSNDNGVVKIDFDFSIQPDNRVAVVVLKSIAE